MSIYRRIKSPIVVTVTFVAALLLAMTGLALSVGATPSVDIKAVAGNFDTFGAPTDGALATSTTLDNPAGVAVDPEGNYVIAERLGYVQVLANTATNPGYVLGDDCGGGSSPCVWTQGDLFTISGGTNPLGDGASALGLTLDNPTGITVDGAGNVIVPLQESSVVVVLAVSTSNPGYPLRSDCGGGSSPCVWTQGDVYYVVGTPSSFASLVDGSTAATSQLNRPDYATFDSSGDLLIDDYNSAIVILAVTSTNPGYVLGDDCGGGSSPCVWTQGDVFTLAGSWRNCNGGSDGQSGFAWNFCESRGIAVDSGGNVVNANSDDDLLVVLAESASNPGYQLESDCGGGSSPCVWTPGDVFILSANPFSSGSTTSGSAATDTAVVFASGTVFDGQGNLLFVNNHYSVVDMLAMSNCSSQCPYGLNSYIQGDVYVIAGGGSPVTATTQPPDGENGPATSAYLGVNSASFLAIDSVNDALVLADSPLNVVRTFDGGEVASTSTTTTMTHHATATTTSTTSTTTTSTTTTTLNSTTTTSVVSKSPIRASFYFALGVTSLNVAQRSRLESLARVVSNERLTSLRIVGYSDPYSTGSAATALGLARARNVAGFLRQSLASLGDGGVIVTTESGGILHHEPYSLDRVAILTS
ncbi:MAG: hypothetical protein WAN30_01710 [Acidimicrobiales bacterium]